jgi:hypothetical protein
MLNKLQSVNKMQVKQTTIAQNNKLFFKVQKNNKLNTVRIVCAYFSTNITQRNAQYVSGDLVNEQDVANTLVRISALHNNAVMQQTD